MILLFAVKLWASFLKVSGPQVQLQYGNKNNSCLIGSLYHKWADGLWVAGVFLFRWSSNVRSSEKPSLNPQSMKYPPSYSLLQHIVFASCTYPVGNYLDYFLTCLQSQPPHYNINSIKVET